mgnify:CR=1 FL=1
MVIAFKRNTLIVLVRQLSMVEIFSVVSLGESTILKQANLSKADFVLTKKENYVSNRNVSNRKLVETQWLL